MRLAGKHPLLLLVIALASTFLAGCASGGSRRTRSSTTRNQRVPITETVKQGSDFVAAAVSLIATCPRTARVVGYRVPCPTRIPPALTPSGGRPGCPGPIIGPGRNCPNTKGGRSWRGWVVGSSSTPAGQDLAIAASPKPLRDYAKLIKAPDSHPNAFKTLGWLTINGWRMRIVFVPPGSNPYSDFTDSVVLIWTVAHHTYGVGFRDVTGRPGIRETLNLDKQLAAGIRLLGS